MKETTRNAIIAIAKTDSTITKAELNAMLNPPKEQHQNKVVEREVLSIKEVCKILGKTRRMVNWYVKKGILKNVKPKGLSRGLGITRTSVMKMLDD